MKFRYLLPILLVGLLSCGSKNKFTVQGVVEDAENQTLYLEYTGLLKTTVLDSVVLDLAGDFKFKAESPEYPDFYRLRLGEKYINFSVDSTEQIHFKANNKNFAMGYKVEGSQNSSDIQTLRKSLSDIQYKANLLGPDLTSEKRASLIAEIQNDIENHKKIARKIILQNARSTAAYYAIYQKIGNTYLFNPYVKEDKPYCAAVATAYNAFMPDYARSKNVYGLVMDAIKVERKEKDQQAWNEILENNSTGYIDIELNNRAGQPVKLSSFEGKVVLIDFSAYEMENSVQYTFELRELYNKYHSRGLEIYQISLDRSKLLWEESTANIPWICVRDEEGPNSQVAGTYNVRSVPTIFLLSRDGVIVGREFDFKTVDSQIAKLL